MRKIHLVLRLFFEAGLSIRAITRSIQASPATVGDYIRRAKAVGLTWPLPDELDERTLEAQLFPGQGAPKSTVPLPDWAQVHTELRRKGVTLALLWQEYKAEHPGGLQYSWFCQRYRAWRGRVDIVMRQTHRAGEKLFVDMPDTRLQLLIATPGSCAKRRSSSPCSVRRTTPSPKRPGRNRWSTGAARMCGRCAFSAAYPNSWCPIIYAQLSLSPTATNPITIPLTRA